MTHLTKVVRLSILVTLCSWSLSTVAHAYSWCPVGPFVPGADLDFMPSQSTQGHRDCAMAIDPFTGYPHIIYVSNSNHQWANDRIFKIMYKYWDGSAWQSATIETLPQELDDPEWPYRNLNHINFGVSIALEKDPTGTYCVGGIAYHYYTHYDYTDANDEIHINEWTNVKYVSLTGNSLNGLMAVGLIESVTDPNPVRWPSIVSLGGANSISLRFLQSNGLQPFIVFGVNSLRIPGLTYLGQVCYRWYDPSTGWTGSWWDEASGRFQDTIYDELSAYGKVLAVSLAMDKSTAVWTPCVAFSCAIENSVPLDYDVSVYYDAPPFEGTPEYVAGFASLDDDYGFVWPDTRLSLRLDPTSAWKPCIAFDGDGVQCTEKNSGVWTTPTVLRPDNTSDDDGETVWLGSLDINVDTGRRWVSTCDIEDDGSGPIYMYHADAGVWSSPLSAGSTGSVWLPFAAIEREYGMPLVMHTGLTGFGVIGYQLENPNVVIRLTDSKSGDGISGASVYIRPTGSSTEIAQYSVSGNQYCFWRVVPKPTNNSVTFEVRAEHPDYTSVPYAANTTLTATWGECNDFLTISMTPIEGCGTAPIGAGVRQSETLWRGVLPLMLALMALAGWALVRLRHAPRG